MPETTSQPAVETPHEMGRWHHLFMYTIAIFAVGVLAGHFMTLCPTAGLRAALYPWSMYVIFGLLVCFALAMFISTGYRLKS